MVYHKQTPLRVEALVVRRASCHILKAQTFGNISLTSFVASRSIDRTEDFTSYLKN